MNCPGSEKFVGHLVVGDSDSRVERGTGVRSSEEDHSGKRHGDSEDSKHTGVLFVLNSGEEVKSHSVLADEVSHDENGGSDEFNPKCLSFGDSSGSEVRELSSTLSRGSFLVLDECVDSCSSKETTDNLRNNHTCGLSKVQ